LKKKKIIKNILKRIKRKFLIRFSVSSFGMLYLPLENCLFPWKTASPHGRLLLLENCPSFWKAASPLGQLLSPENFLPLENCLSPWKICSHLRKLALF
jgi:hypothetical protein